MSEIYHGLFSSLEDVLNDWTMTAEQKEELKRANVLFAAYDHEGWEGDAFLLYELNGKLYEVNDSHCSCYGLSDFTPEETSVEALQMRHHDYGVFQQFKTNLMDALRNRYPEKFAKPE